MNTQYESDFDERLRRTFREATVHVSLNTHYRLEQAAQAAIRAPTQLAQATPAPSSFWKWLGLGVGGGAVLASVFVISIWNAAPAVNSPAAVAESESGPAASTDPIDWSADLDEDPSMYAWVASSEAAVAVR